MLLYCIIWLDEFFFFFHLFISFFHLFISFSGSTESPSSERRLNHHSHTSNNKNSSSNHQNHDKNHKNDKDIKEQKEKDHKAEVSFVLSLNFSVFSFYLIHSGREGVNEIIFML